jgi:PAS domain S-box-containing protein
VKLEGQKRRAQIELQRRESIYSRVTERIVGTIYEIEADGTLAFVNESQKPVLGFEPENMIGKKLASFVDPECVEAFETALREASQTHLVRAVELSMRRSGGESACVDLIVDSIEDETGRITGFVVAIRDITETKNLIQTLQKQTHELEDRVRERTERIRILDENSSQRVRNLVKQLTQISEIRDRLKRNPSMKSGFNLVLKNSMRDLSMNAGGIFLLNPLDHLVETKAISPGKNSTVRPVYSLDDPYLEFDALYSKELVSKTVGNGRSLLGTEEIHCAPISWNNIRGIIALGSDQNRKLDESELSILKLYSALVAEILKSSNLNIKPRKEMDQAGQGRCRVKPGNGYIVPDDVGLAYELFLEAIMSGTEGLCITRTAPARIRDRYSLQRTPVIWLTDEAVEGEKTVHTLQDLSILISNYVRRATKPVILIDGIEYLISHKNFESVYHLLQAKRTQMEAYQGILIVPFFRDAVETKEAKLLERELRVFGADADLYTPREALAEAQVSSD